MPWTEAKLITQLYKLVMIMIYLKFICNHWFSAGIYSSAVSLPYYLNIFFYKQSSFNSPSSSARSLWPTINHLYMWGQSIVVLPYTRILATSPHCNTRVFDLWISSWTRWLSIQFFIVCQSFFNHSFIGYGSIKAPDTSFNCPFYHQRLSKILNIRWKH